MKKTHFIWSRKRNAWYRPNSQGYTLDPGEAGLYTEEDARSRHEEMAYLIPVEALLVLEIVRALDEVDRQSRRDRIGKMVFNEVRANRDGEE